MGSKAVSEERHCWLLLGHQIGRQSRCAVVAVLTQHCRRILPHYHSGSTSRAAPAGQCQLPFGQQKKAAKQLFSSLSVLLEPDLNQVFTSIGLQSFIGLQTMGLLVRSN